MRGIDRLAAAAVVLALTGCAHMDSWVKPYPWVKPYDRQNFADIIMSRDRDPVSTAYINHVLEAREGARGASGSQGGGCGCN